MMFFLLANLPVGLYYCVNESSKFGDRIMTYQAKRVLFKIRVALRSGLLAWAQALRSWKLLFSPPSPESVCVDFWWSINGDDIPF